MESRWMVLLLVTLSLAGCSDGSDGTPGPQEENDDGTQDSFSSPDQTNGTTTAEPEEPVQEVWYFTADGGLQNTTPPAGSMNPALAATSPVTGFDVAEFLSTPEDTPRYLVPQDVEVVLYFTSEAPMPSNQAFDYAIWGGSTKGMPLFALGTHDPVVAPGDVVEARMTLAFGGQRGVWVPAGDSLRFLVGGNFLPGQEADTLEMLVGGDQASHVVLTTQIRMEDPVEAALEQADEAHTGQVVQVFSPTDCDAAPGTTSLVFDIPLAADGIGVQGELRATGSLAPVADLDIDVMDGSTIIASGHTPYDDEKFYLVGPAYEGLAGKTVQAKVSTCGQGPIDFELQVVQWTAPADDATAGTT